MSFFFGSKKPNKSNEISNESNKISDTKFRLLKSILINLQSASTEVFQAKISLERFKIIYVISLNIPIYISDISTNKNDTLAQIKDKNDKLAQIKTVCDLFSNITRRLLEIDVNDDFDTKLAKMNFGADIENLQGYYDCLNTILGEILTLKSGNNRATSSVAGGSRSNKKLKKTRKRNL